MKNTEAVQKIMANSGKGAMGIGLIVAVLCIALGRGKNLPQFYQSYLMAFNFWIGISAGSLALLMVHHVAGGGWGFVSRRIFEAAIRTLPLMAVLFIPIILGMHDIYHWSVPGVMEHDQILQKKSAYLNANGFIIRTAVYFIIWMGLGTMLCRWSAQQDETGDETLNRPMRMWSGIGIVLYALTATMAGWDWTMSLEPHWFSSMWGPLFFVGQGLTTFAFAIVILRKFTEEEPLSSYIKPVHFRDLGNFTFAFVILWTYMSFAQFIIIWSGNLPEEISWFLSRSTSEWKFVAVLLTLFHFALPFLLLLSRYSKLRARYLAKIALFILVIRYLDTYWVVKPTFDNPGGLADIHVLDILLPIAMGGIWMGLFFRKLSQQALLPKHDPRFETAPDAETAVSHG